MSLCPLCLLIPSWEWEEQKLEREVALLQDFGLHITNKANTFLTRFAGGQQVFNVSLHVNHTMHLSSFQCGFAFSAHRNDSSCPPLRSLRIMLRLRGPSYPIDGPWSGEWVLCHSVAPSQSLCFHAHTLLSLSLPLSPILSPLASPLSAVVSLPSRPVAPPGPEALLVEYVIYSYTTQLRRHLHRVAPLPQLAALGCWPVARVSFVYALHFL